LNYFDFEGKNSMKEDDTTDTVYASEQSLDLCGFIPGTTKAYALNSLYIEIIDLETAELFTKIEKIPHEYDYVIGPQVYNNHLVLHVGNYKGEMFTYSVDPNKKQKVENGMVIEDCLTLESTMVVQNLSEDNNCIRNAVIIDDERVIVTTEANSLEVYKRKKIDGNGYQEEIMADLQMDPEDSDDEMGSGGKILHSKHKKEKKGFRLF
jgi:hypothetical protein